MPVYKQSISIHLTISCKRSNIDAYVHIYETNENLSDCTERYLEQH